MCLCACVSVCVCCMCAYACFSCAHLWVCMQIWRPGNHLLKFSTLYTEVVSLSQTCICQSSFRIADVSLIFQLTLGILGPYLWREKRQVGHPSWVSEDVNSDSHAYVVCFNQLKPLGHPPSCKVLQLLYLKFCISNKPYFPTTLPALLWLLGLLIGRKWPRQLKESWGNISSLRRRILTHVLTTSWILDLPPIFSLYPLTSIQF